MLKVVQFIQDRPGKSTVSLVLLLHSEVNVAQVLEGELVPVLKAVQFIQGHP